MFYDLYITTKYEEPIYFSIIALSKSVEVSLYIGKKLVRRKSLQRGLHVLEKDNIKLKVQLKTFKAIPELSIENEKIEVEKLKRKDFIKILTDLNIHNELNPIKKAPQAFNYKKLIAPSILIFIGTICQLTISNNGKFYEVPSMLFFIIAYYQLFSPLINKVPQWHMDDETKGKFKFLAGLGFMILTHILIDELIK